MEKLFDIVEFPDYKVTRSGEIYSLFTNKFLHQHIRDEKYFVVGLSKGDFSYTRTVHRIVAIAFKENPDKKPYVNHIDGNKLNNNDWNLEWVTAKENTSHAIKMGLINVPQIMPLRSKVVVDLATGLEYKSVLEASKVFGISRSYLGEMLNGDYENTTSLILKK